MPQSLSPEQASALGKRGAREKKVAAIERRIKELVDSAPPLTDEQRDRLAVLLRGSAA